VVDDCRQSKLKGPPKSVARCSFGKRIEEDSNQIKSPERTCKERWSAFRK
jgi:hypothetical protein